MVTLHPQILLIAVNVNLNPPLSRTAEELDAVQESAPL